jgi:hypothetical protein
MLIALRLSTAADLLVALGTLVLAVVTAWMATKTHDLADTTREAVDAAESQARATREAVVAAEKQVGVSNELVRLGKEQLSQSLGQLRTSQQQLELALTLRQEELRPLLVDAPRGPIPERGVNIQGELVKVMDMGTIIASVPSHGYSAMVALPIRNIGPGIALVTDVKLGAVDPGPGAPGRIERSVLPSGESTYITFLVENNDGSENELLIKSVANSRFTIWVHYGDLSGTQRFRSCYHVVAGPFILGSGGFVKQIDLYTGDSTVPFATTGGIQLS